MDKPRIVFSVLSALFTGALSGGEPTQAGGGQRAPRYPDHSKLLRVLEADGRERPVETEKDWKLRREHILLGMQEVMGEFRLGGVPAAGKRAVEFKVVEEADAGSYLRRLISYAAGEGDRVPAFLLLPKKRDGRLPAILCLHQTTPRGKAEPTGLAGREDLHVARHLVERGYVTLAPDYPNFGDHPFDTYGRGYRSGSMKAIEDNVRAVDLLSSLPEVDPERIGCIGHSLGGHNTLFTAVFDERIRAMVSNCGFTAFGSYYGGNLAGWSSKTYMPGIPSYGGWRNVPFDFHEVVAALAPRPFLAIAPLSDSNFEVKGVREVMESAAEVYRLLGAGEKLVLHTPDCGHDFPPAAREKAYEWFDRWLKR